MKILIFIALILTIFVFNAEGQVATLAIKLNNTNPVQYCSGSKLVAENLTIEGLFTITGMKISFSDGYKPGEDELVYSGSIGNIVGTWYAAQGYLLLKGNANTTSDDYRNAITKSVAYKNNNSIPTVGIRKISITLEDADYLPETGHFYRFVENPNLSWSAARADASSATYYGLKGYLATITSQVENDFIKLKTRGVGWIGASDAWAEGEWRWVTGPEGLEDSGKGRLFFVTGSGPYQGEYTNWNTGEPNNVNGGENYAHITVFPSDAASSYKWNDLPDSGGQGDYASKGYLIEFGGFPGEPELNLSATLILQVNTMSFFKPGIQSP
ncbi:MAG TPA: lectin-like protein, partial [Prolixibacteraceae bacterium]